MVAPLPLGMVDRSRGGYYEWRAFLRCPNCGSDAIELDAYDEGTFVRCRDCGAEAWAAGFVEAD